MARRPLRLLPRLTRTLTAGSAGSARRGRSSDSRGDGRYPGDHAGVPPMTREPDAASPAPGQVVWTWVPYEEDHGRGKDRPVLLVGRDEPWLLGLPLTSEDHDLDEDQERAAGRHWVDIGSGAWDRQGRRSEARVDRVVRVDPHQVRGDGVLLDERIFAAVAEAVRAVAEGRDYDDDPA